MARIDPVKKANKWKASMGNAAQNYKDGIASVTDSPMAAAVQKQDTLKARFNQAIDSGQWAQATGSVTLQSWQASAQKGADRLVSGADKGAPKMLSYLQKAAPVIEQIRAEIKQMPNATDSDRQARMIRNMQLMKQLKGINKR